MARTVLSAGFDYGDYHVRSLLGKGAMAEVSLATNRRNGQHVALKVLARGFGDADVRLRRFEREADAMAATNHRNVVAIYDVGQYNRTPFIAMDRIDENNTMLPRPCASIDRPAAWSTWKFP